MIGKTDVGGRVKQLLEKLLALEEGRFTKIVAIAKEKIERKKDDGKFRDKVRARITDVHTFLKFFEVAAAAIVKNGDFPVENSLRGGEGLGEMVEFGIMRGDVVAGTGANCELSVADESECADAVPFDFEEPVGIGERAIRESGEHRGKLRRHGGFAGILQFVGAEGGGGAFGSELLLDFVEDASGKDGAVVVVDIPVRIGG